MSTLRDETLKMHMEKKGKVGVCSKLPLRIADDLSLAYPPGVAEPCMEIYNWRFTKDSGSNRNKISIAKAS